MENMLEKWMQVNGYGDTSLAEKLGVDRSYVYLLRTGKRPMTDAFRWQFGREFGFPMAVRVLGTGEKEHA